MKKIINYFFANLFPSITAYFLLPVYGLYLSKSEYGVVGKLEVFTYIFSILSLLAMDRAVVRYYYDSENNASRHLVLSSILWLSLVTSVIFIIISFYVIDTGMLSVKGHNNALYYLILSVVITNQSLLVGRIMQARGASITFVLMQAMKAIAVFIFSYLYVTHLSSGVYGYAKGLFIASLVLLPFILVEYSKYLRATFSISIAISVLKFSIPFIPTLLAAWLFSMYGRVVVEQFVGLEALGDFTMSFKLASVLLMVNAAIVLTFTPYFFKTATERLGEIKIMRSISMLQVISIAIFVAFSFLINDIITWILPNKYGSISQYVVILNAGLFVSCSMSYSTNLVYLHFKKTFQHMLIYLIAGSIAAFTNYWLGWSYGVLGVCFALLITNLFLYLFHSHYSKKFSNIECATLFFMILAALSILFIGYLGIYLSHLGDLIIGFKFIFTFVIFFVVSRHIFMKYKNSVKMKLL